MTRDPKGRWGSPAGPSAVLALALLLTGCAVGGEPEISSTPKRELAVRPDPVTTGVPSSPAVTTPAAPGTTATTTPTRPGATTAPTATRPASAAPAAPVPAPAGEGPYRAIGSLTDARGDAGREGPTYSDVLGVLLEEDGTRLRATVRMSGAVPLTTAAGEVLGIGVDLYDRSGEFESDYQLFADGGSDGWFAYLATPKGFAKYSGRFQITGDQLVFTVPWSTVGGRRGGWTKAFSDWTREGGGTLGGNRTANDRAPLAGTTGYGL